MCVGYYHFFLFMSLFLFCVSITRASFACFFLILSCLCLFLSLLQSIITSILFRADLVDMNSFSWFTSWKVFLYSSTMTDNFAELSSLGLNLWFSELEVNCYKLFQLLRIPLKNNCYFDGFSFMCDICFFLLLFLVSSLCSVYLMFNYHMLWGVSSLACLFGVQCFLYLCRQVFL